MSSFPPGSVIRRVDSEGALLLGGGRALLMQLAHPAVAQGVADHSDFSSDPLARLRRTLEATHTIVFGTEDEAALAAARVRAVHDRVTGPAYAANDPALLCWVNATLIDTALVVHRAVLGPLSRDELEEYYEQSTCVAEALGCPRSAQPATYADFRAYVREMVHTLEVTDTAREVARSVLHPRLGPVVEPPLALARFITVGSLPRRLRRQYGLRWDGRRAVAFRMGATAARTIVPLVPGPVRRAPMAVLTRAA